MNLSSDVPDFNADEAVLSGARQEGNKCRCRADFQARVQELSDSTPTDSLHDDHVDFTLALV